MASIIAAVSVAAHEWVTRSGAKGYTPMNLGGSSRSSNFPALWFPLSYGVSGGVGKATGQLFIRSPR